MRYVRYGFLGVLGLVLVTVSLANRAPVQLRVVPEGLVPLLGSWAEGAAIELPLFVALLGGVALGVLVGFVWEWLREARIRRNAGELAREIRRLEREERRLRAKAGEEDEIESVIASASEPGTAPLRRIEAGTAAG